MWVGDEGEVEEHFLGLMKMRACKAADFVKAVLQFCDDKALSINLIRFLAFDGCSTISGSKSAK
ncbi:hypothetical protein DPMN_023417 [Dreissena polymorpha]|uniref:Uncharacterized protein n=1 Tax=Dreissena polymorpha TaxID=45954 RepID=A0A9D4LPM5_DREPO|nr:hypothetical protein DPMN_023417 [Dreissena polymorpha]